MCALNQFFPAVASVTTRVMIIGRQGGARGDGLVCIAGIVSEAKKIVRFTYTIHTDTRGGEDDNTWREED